MLKTNFKQLNNIIHINYKLGHLLWLSFNFSSAKLTITTSIASFQIYTILHNNMWKQTPVWGRWSPCPAWAAIGDVHEFITTLTNYIMTRAALATTQTKTQKLIQSMASISCHQCTTSSKRRSSKTTGFGFQNLLCLTTSSNRRLFLILHHNICENKHQSEADGALILHELQLEIFMSLLQHFQIILWQELP